MQKALVIADDFTGAAEIAGIGRRFGLPARILRRPATDLEPGVTVLDTDSRLLPPAEAAEAVLRFVEPLRDAIFDLIFKKTDSVLRGSIAAELDALPAMLGRTSVLLVPQNPSRGRAIIDGEYFVDGTPLHETAFAHDPTHPARSSDVAMLLGPHAGLITVGDGASAADLRDWAFRVGSGTLPAGGADFFTALLERNGFNASPSSREVPRGPLLFVCGSSRPHPPLKSVAICPMTDSTAAWCGAIIPILLSGQNVMMTIGRPLDAAPGAAARIEQRVATVAAAALHSAPVRAVFVTGGATAAAVCRAMGWMDFGVECELAPGVVQLRPAHPPDTSLIVKPGSYAWPPQCEVD